MALCRLDNVQHYKSEGHTVDAEDAENIWTYEGRRNGKADKLMSGFTVHFSLYTRFAKMKRWTEDVHSR
jgi:hypothetical protein